MAVTKCANDPTLNIGSVLVTVTNHSNKASNYIATVTISSPDGKTQIDTGTGVVQSLEPGQTTETNAVLKPILAGSVCKVSDVTRVAASGG